MKRTVLIVLFLTMTACQATSSGGSSSGGSSSGSSTSTKHAKASALGCDKDDDAVTDYQTVQTGVSNKTMTPQDAATQFGNMASDLKTATEVDTGKARLLEADAEVRAGRIRVDLLSVGSTPHLAADRNHLVADLSKLGKFC